VPLRFFSWRADRNRMPTDGDPSWGRRVEEISRVGRQRHAFRCNFGRSLTAVFSSTPKKSTEKRHLPEERKEAMGGDLGTTSFDGRWSAKKGVGKETSMRKGRYSFSAFDHYQKRGKSCAATQKKGGGER